ADLGEKLLDSFADYVFGGATTRVVVSRGTSQAASRNDSSAGHSQSGSPNKNPLQNMGVDIQHGGIVPTAAGEPGILQNG
ncbi:unnamed protein product, partial [Amoebophrya sp. A25]